FANPSLFRLFFCFPVACYANEREAHERPQKQYHDRRTIMRPTKNESDHRADPETSPPLHFEKILRLHNPLPTVLPVPSEAFGLCCAALWYLAYERTASYFDLFEGDASSFPKNR